jgi:hypothetical protein
MSLPLLHAGRTNPGISAALDLKFASTLSLTSSSGITPSFSRASSGTYFGSDGLLKYAGLNVAQYSQDLENAFWGKLGSSVTSNTITAPDGSLTADKIVESSGGTYHNINYTTFSTSGSWTASVYLKAGERSYASIEIIDNFRAVINLSDGTVVSNTLAGSTISTANAGNGWWRVSYTVSNITRVIIYTLNSSTFGPYSGDGASGIYAWGIQLESGTTATTYGKTLGASNSAPRFDHTYDGTSWISRGLLVEEQRTNQYLRSHEIDNAYTVKTNGSVTANNTTSPDGTTTADKFVENSSAGLHGLGSYISGLTTTSGLRYTFSGYFKAAGRNFVRISMGDGVVFGDCSAWVNLTTGAIGTTTQGSATPAATFAVTNAGNGWYRLECNATAKITTGTSVANAFYLGTADNVISYTGDGTSGVFVWGIQFEEGAFASSLIQTSGSTVTRSADVCQITGSDFSSFWNASEGSVAVECDRMSLPSVTSFAWEAYADTLNKINNEQDATGPEYFGVRTGGTDVVSMSTMGVAAKVVSRNAFGFKANDFAASLNGAAVITDTSGTLPTVSNLAIGSRGTYGTTYPLNGHIARLRYFNKRLTDKQLEDLCRPEDQLKLDLKFSENLSLTPVVGPTPSFSRASSGTYFGSDGLLKYANVNQVLYSEDFSNAAWVKQNVTVSTNDTTAPDGKLTADKITENNATAYFNIYNGSAVSHSAGAILTVSGFFKYGTRKYIQLIAGPAAAGFGVVADIEAGTITATGSSGSATYISSNISSAGNGWYRVTVTGTLPTANTGYFDIFTSNVSTYTNPYPSFTSTGQYMWIWGAQLETGSTPGTYVPTTNAANSAPRFDYAYDGTSWISKGLLIEEQRTNSLTHSQDATQAIWVKRNGSISSNFALAPDGTMTADKLIPSAANTDFYFNGVTTAATSTLSVFAKAAGYDVVRLQYDLGQAAIFNLTSGTVTGTGGSSTGTIINVGGGWYRCILTSTAVGVGTNYPIFAINNASFDGTSGVLFWGMQSESGAAFSTSYIPTTTTSVVRSADVCQITGTDFSGFYNQSEGSVIADYDRIGVDNSKDSEVFQVTNSSGASQYYLDGQGGNEFSNFYVSPTTQASLALGLIKAAGISAKTSVAYRVNDFSASRDGGSVVTDTSGTVPTVDRMGIGRDVAANNFSLNGHISRLRYYAIRLPDRLLIAKSQ